MRQYFTHINEVLDPFFDVIRNWVEATGQLSCHFMRQVDMSHVFAVFHDAHDASLRTT